MLHPTIGFLLVPSAGLLWLALQNRWLKADARSRLGLFIGLAGLLQFICCYVLFIYWWVRGI